MKFRVGYEKLKEFSNPVKKAEEVNEWGWWGFICSVSGNGGLFHTGSEIT